MDNLNNNSSKSKKLINKLFKHKILIIVIAAAAAGGFYYYKNKTQNTNITTYTIGEAAKSTIMTTVSGSGQISSSNQVDIKPEADVESKISKITVKAGDKLKQGDVIAELETKEFMRNVNNAKNSLNIAVANLNTKLAGLTKEELIISENSVKTAKMAYDNSLISLENAKQTAEDNLSKMQLALDNAKLSLENAQRNYDNSLTTQGINTDSSSRDLTNSYTSAQNLAGTTLISMRSALTSADNILGIDHDPVNQALKTLLGAKKSQSVEDAKNSYITAKSALNDYDKAYNETAINWKQAEVDNLLVKALNVLQLMKKMQSDIYDALANTVTSSDLSQSTLDGYKQTISSSESSIISSLNSVQSAQQSIYNAKNGITTTGITATSSINSAASSLETAKNSYTTAVNNLKQAEFDNKKNLNSAESDVASKKISYENAQAQFKTNTSPPRAVDIATLRIQVSQAQENYNDAVEDLKNAKILAPYDCTVAKVYQSAGDSANPSTAIATIVTAKQFATITLNETDAVNVKIGQKATLTFSALDDLSLTGEVAEIDGIGTVSQGVVSYEANIALDIQDDKVKPQMSVSVVITTNEAIDVLTVPSSAIKEGDDNTSYVEVLPSSVKISGSTDVEYTGNLEQKYIVVGLTDGTNTQVISGLSEGDKIITKTTTGQTAQTKTTNTNAKSGLNMMGGMGGPR